MVSGRPTGSQSLRQSLRGLLIGLVGLSSGLTAFYAEASLAVVAGSAAFGLVFGLLVVTIALPTAPEKSTNPRLRWDE